MNDFAGNVEADAERVDRIDAAVEACLWLADSVEADWI